LSDPDFTHVTPLLSLYGFEMPSGTETTMTNSPAAVETFSVIGFTVGYTIVEAVFEIN
jgi:hypothetical protein